MDTEISYNEITRKIEYIRAPNFHSIPIDNQNGLKRDELHELMTEVFILGYLKSQGKFANFTKDEISYLYRKKMKEKKIMDSMGY